MATATRAHTIVNRGGRRRNKPRRHLTAKQIRAGFGGKRRQSALRHRAAAKRTAPKKVNRPRRHAAAKKRIRRNVAHRARTPKRSNPERILSLVLPNTGRRGNMAARKHRKHNKSHKHHRNAVARRRNTGGHAKRHNRRIRRHNPGLNVMQLLTDSLFVIGGAVGSKILTQAVLQSKNAGLFGYFGNAVATGLIAWGAHAAAPHKPHLRDSLILGGVVQIVLRGIADYAPVSIASYAKQFGVGDYQITGFVVPQRLKDALNSAEVEVPLGFGPGQMVAQPAAPAGMGDIYGSLT